MALDGKMKRYLEKQINEFMNELEDTMSIANQLKIEHTHDFIFGYLYGTLFALAYEYINGMSSRKGVELSYEEFTDLFQFIFENRAKISDALFYRGIT